MCRTGILNQTFEVGTQKAGNKAGRERTELGFLTRCLKQSNVKWKSNKQEFQRWPALYHLYYTGNNELDIFPSKSQSWAMISWFFPERKWWWSVRHWGPTTKCLFLRTIGGGTHCGDSLRHPHCCMVIELQQFLKNNARYEEAIFSVRIIVTLLHMNYFWSRSQVLFRCLQAVEGLACPTRPHLWLLQMATVTSLMHARCDQPQS